MKRIPLLFILGVMSISCVQQKFEQNDYFNTSEFLEDSVLYDESNPYDILNIAASLPVYEIYRTDLREYLSKEGEIYSDGAAFTLEGDGAQGTISVHIVSERPETPVTIRLTIGSPISDHMSVYILERSEGGWKRLSSEYTS